jgi:hypothetical protein
VDESKSGDFTIFEAAPPPNFCREVREHVAATGLPETFPGLHRGPISKDEEHIILCPISVPRNKRPENDRAPCPMCQPNKFYDGRLVYLPRLKVVAVIGCECASGSKAAQAEYRRGLAVEAAQDLLIATLPTIAGRLRAAEALAPAASECERFYSGLRREGAYFANALRRASRGGSQLTVAEAMSVAAGGPAGMRTSGSGGSTRDVAFGRLAGAVAVASRCTLAADLVGLEQVLRPMAAAASEDEALEIVVSIPESERPAVAKQLTQALTGLTAAEESMSGFRAFLAPANLQRITDWGSHPENATPMSASRVPYGSSGKQLIRFDAPGGRYCSIVVGSALWGYGEASEA